jgi:hypothetical protein
MFPRVIRSLRVAIHQHISDKCGGPARQPYPRRAINHQAKALSANLQITNQWRLLAMECVEIQGNFQEKRRMP